MQGHLAGRLLSRLGVPALKSGPRRRFVPRPKGQTLMKGRPITAEEFDRMLAAVPKVRPQEARARTRFLTGLWLSGLRLSEACALSWDEDAPFWWT